MLKSNVAAVISAAAGMALIHAASKEADRIQRPMAIAIVDPTGTIRHFHRMDGVRQLAVQIAMDKAYTASAMGVPSSAWFGMIKDDPVLLHGMVQTPRLVIVAGGVPLYENGVLVGALGVSGGHYSEDESVALAAIQEVGFDSVSEN
jgi:uncharacterized protein GlcG (DUF336 family)